MIFSPGEYNLGKIMPSRDLGTITAEIGNLLREIYDLGRSTGHAEGRVEGEAAAKSKIKSTLSDLFGDAGSRGAEQSPPTSVLLRNQKHAWSDRQNRATPGSIRPAVLDALRISNVGLRPPEIAAATGIKENTVRGALNFLRQENKTHKWGGLWFFGPTTPEHTISEEGMRDLGILPESEVTH